jgi:hypothetical protein
MASPLPLYEIIELDIGIPISKPINMYPTALLNANFPIKYKLPTGTKAKAVPCPYNSLLNLFKKIPTAI